MKKATHYQIKAPTMLGSQSKAYFEYQPGEGQAYYTLSQLVLKLKDDPRLRDEGYVLVRAFCAQGKKRYLYKRMIRFRKETFERTVLRLIGTVNEGSRNVL